MIRMALLLLAVLVTGCGNQQEAVCSRLLEAEDYEAAIVQCEQAFATTGSPVAGEAVARAHHAQGQLPELRQWLGRLAGQEPEGVAWGLLGDLHFRAGDLGSALSSQLRAVALHEAAANPALASRSLYWLFYLSWQKSDLRAALEYASRAAEQAAMAEKPDAEATAFEGLYTVFLEIGDLDAARQAVERATELAGEDPARQRRLWVHEGTIRRHEGRLALARHSFERALAAEQASGGSQGASNSQAADQFLRSTHLNLVETHLDLADLPAAERHLAAAMKLGDEGLASRYFRAKVAWRQGKLEDASQMLEGVGDAPADWRWNISTLRGHIAEDLGQSEAAIAAYSEAIAVLEELRGSLGFDDLKSWLLDKKREPYEALFRLHAAQGRPIAAIDITERARARAFLDAFVQASMAEDAEIAPAEGGEPAWRVAANRATALQALLPSMGQSEVVHPRPFDELIGAIDELRILAFFTAADDVWRIFVDHGVVDVQKLAIGKSELDGKIDSFTARLQDGDLATELGRVLLPESAIAGTEALYIVADGSLGQLPFAALQHQRRFLVETHDLVFVPSLNALAMSHAREAAREANGPAVVLGDPTSDLPAAVAEAMAVAARLGIEANIGKAANRQQLAASGGARLLHIAGHTGLGATGPWLALADGRVTAGEIVEQQLGPRIVVLATCASAARQGRGLWGSLGAAFLAAGSQRVLASLWSVEDEVARQLTLRFYHEGGEHAPARALAQAQRASIANGDPPADWAPFVLFGAGATAANF